MYSVEVRDEDTSHGAILCALATTCAEAVINSRKVVENRDSAARAGFLALLTADAGIGAFLSCRRALFLILAGNEHAFNVCHKSYQLLRAGANTNSATDALTCIDMRDAILEADRILRTDLNAVAKTDASEGAFAVAAVHRLCRLTA